MADLPSSSATPPNPSGEPLAGPPPPSKPKKKVIPSKSSLKEDKVALRRHKAIEKQVRRAEQLLTPVPPPITVALPLIGSLSPDHSELATPVPPAQVGQVATPPPMVPTNREELVEVVSDLKTSIIEAITQGLAALHQGQGRRPSSTPLPSASQEAADLADADLWPSRSQVSSHHGSESEAEEGELMEGTFSEDESPLPEVQAPPGLFPPALFRSLLYKAKATADLEASPSTSEGKPKEARAQNSLFYTPPSCTEEVPTPQIVLDSITKQWLKPASHVAPSNNEKKFYLPGKALNDLLQSPSVEDPVAALLSATPVSGDPADLLKPEDKRLESTVKYDHQSSAWAIKASSAATFFARTSLMWLRHLQQLLPPTDARLHQDVSKIIAATQFSADATLDAVRFSARAMGASTTTRRLLWLRSWQADLKAKWRLASGPFQGDKLFGPALDPLLIETKDKRKILPSHARRQNRRYSPYPKFSTFRPPASSASSSNPPQAQPFQYQPRQFPRRQERNQDFRDRYKQFPQAKRPFRGPSGRPTRKSR